MAVSGHNGNNESFIGMSASIGLEIYDQNMNEIRMAESRMTIDLIIQKDSNLLFNTSMYRKLKFQPLI